MNIDMNRKLFNRRVALSVLLLASASGFSRAAAQIMWDIPQPRSSDPQTAKVQDDLENLKKAAATIPLREMERTIDPQAAEWDRLPDKGLYLQFMTGALDILSSQQVKPDERVLRSTLVHKYAQVILKQADALPIPVEASVASSLRMQVHFDTEPDIKARVEERGRELPLLLHPWKRFLKAFDPNFNPAKDPPFMYVPLPDGVPGFPGTPPEAIQDEKKRAEYIAAIKRDHEKRERITQHLSLIRVQQTYLHRMEEYLIEAYSTPPFRTDELIKALKEVDTSANNKEDERKKHIINAVTANMKARLDEEERELKAESLIKSQ